MELRVAVTELLARTDRLLPADEAPVRETTRQRLGTGPGRARLTSSWAALALRYDGHLGPQRPAVVKPACRGYDLSPVTP
jgi:hypothetical protein